MYKKNTNRLRNGLFLVVSVLIILFASFQTSYAFTKDDISIGSNKGSNDYSVTFKSDGEPITTVSLLKKYQKLLAVFTTFCTITLMGVFMLNITKLAASADNPYDRKSAITSLIWSGIAIAIFGSATFWFGYFFFFMKAK